MRILFLPAVALALLGAWSLPGEKDADHWAGPVVLHRPPPMSDAVYRAGFTAALATTAPVFAAASSSPSGTRPQPSSVQNPDSSSTAYLIDERELRDTINQDIARMKGIGIGMNSGAADLIGGSDT